VAAINGSAVARRRGELTERRDDPVDEADRSADI
jgi:hypothetical protein